jgi:hypothetical protein
MFGYVFHRIIDTTEQLSDKIYGGHGVRSPFKLVSLSTISLTEPHDPPTSTIGY